MQLQLIRSATVRFTYNGHKFLIDPYLASKFSLPPYRGKSKNPLVDLPFSIRAILEGLEMVIVSHLHSDHFDKVAREILPTDMALLCQPEDQIELIKMGFKAIIAVNDQVNWNGISITRTQCRHGSGNVLDEMGIASGFLFSAPNEPTIYWAGDTILFDGVLEIISRVKPDIIITHSCGAVWGNNSLIVMDASQTISVCQASLNGVIIATHMDSVDHATVNRIELREYANQHGIRKDKLLIPENGEIYVID